ncbi:MAG TPA: Gfo/Idh/MocA family oxidoreductase [Acidimicrobiales bacterium]|nr:Gfo/Idh/MocA family oxidoreductase [Acidimicrobiales bacterium]
MTTLRVGLVGAGPWARFVHAPMLADHPGTTLAGIWARRPEAADDLAAAHGTQGYARMEELLDGCDAVAFAVPPDVQAELAVVAARAGKALLLEKPIALDLTAATRLAEAVGEAGVGSQVLLTWRYTAGVRAFLADLADREPLGGRAQFVSASALGGPFATPWRLEHGALLDLGPHVIDLLDAALGPVVRIRAHGDPNRWLGLLLDHESGAVSEASLSMRSPIDPARATLEIHTASGVVDLDAAAVAGPAAFTTVVDELIETARGVPHPLDVRRGLHLQQLLDAAHRDLRS